MTWHTLAVVLAFILIVALAYPQRRHIMAVAHLTFLDAIRKKVLAVFVLFAVIVIGVSQFFPVFRVEDRLRVVESTCFWCISTFGMIVAIFVAALSLPADLTEKTLYTVATKPIHRRNIILGKVLGLAGISAVILALMGGASLLAIHYVDARVQSQTHGPTGLVARGVLLASEQYIVGAGLERQDGEYLVTGEAHSAFVWFFPHPALLRDTRQKAQVVLAARFGPQPGFTEQALPLFIELRRGEKWGFSLPIDLPPGQIWQRSVPPAAIEMDPAGRASVFEVAIGPRIPFKFKGRLKDLVMFVNGQPVYAEKIAPRADGLSPKRTITWLSRATPHQAVWVIRDLKPARLPSGPVEGIADLRISPGRLGPKHIRLLFTFGEGTRQFKQEVKAVQDRPTRFFCPRDCISPEGVLTIAVERMDSETFLGIPDRGRFGIYARQGSFAWNFIKGTTVIFLQLVLLSAAAVTGSTFLSAPVSVLFAFFIFFCGNLIDFMRNAATILSWGVVHTHGPQTVIASWWNWFLDHFSKVVEVVLPQVAKAMPDLQRYDVAGMVMSGDDIPAGMMLDAAVYFGIFMIVAVVGGQIIFGRKEIE